MKKIQEHYSEKINITSIPVQIFQYLFGVCFALVLTNVLFNTKVYGHPVFLTCITALVTLIIISCVYKLIQEKQKFFDKNYRLILTISAIILFALQMILGNELRFSPIFDLEAVYQGAIKWVTTGRFDDYTSNTCHSDYFYIFPNNLGTLTLLASIFKIPSLLGITDYFSVAMTVNGAMVTATMIFTSLICKKLYGYKGGILAILLFLISPPFYFIAPVFYTDSLSLLFPVLAFYLILKIGGGSHRLSSQISIVITALFILAIGTLVKPTVSIFAVAICIVLLVLKRWKQVIGYVFTYSLVLAIVMGTFNAYIYTQHLDKTIAEYKNTPITYWLNLAFHGDGRYNSQIDMMSRISDTEKRDKVLMELLQTSLKEKSVNDYIKLFKTKSTIAFGDGTYALSDFLDDNPEKKGELHKALLYSGENYKTYSSVCTGIFSAILLLMLLSVKRKENHIYALMAQISVFGVLLFLMMWEINARYITTYIPFIFICAVSGIENIKSCRLMKRFK